MPHLWCSMFVAKHTKNLCEIITVCNVGVKAISEDGPASRVLLRKEVLRLIINLSSSVGTKGHETGLLTYYFCIFFPYRFILNCWQKHLILIVCFKLHFIHRIKEKFSYAFDDICLYSEVSNLLAHCTFRLASRRFIQELFQDVQFMPVRPY